jgi:hypothetical protein
MFEAAGLVLCNLLEATRETALIRLLKVTPGRRHGIEILKLII